MIRWIALAGALGLSLLASFQRHPGAPQDGAEADAAVRADWGPLP